ncbi:CsbD family protein [Levilactobacillus sp. HBUAS70063]|uniref:CsbD family protein n=1 Tax=Levilactobacillus sp. HBUAS70063 TaxID=3109359 RepID=UPI003132B75F
MKNLLLGVSLAANVALAYLVVADRDQLKALQSRADSAMDQVAGKAQQIKGTLTGDVSDKLKGNLREGRGEVKSVIDDVKSEFN